MGDGSVYDKAAALARLEGDHELFDDLATLFLEESPKELAAIRLALDRHDAAALAASAHKLKGSVTQFCAQPLFESVKRLEGLARAGDLAAALTCSAEVESGLTALQAALRSPGHGA